MRMSFCLLALLLAGCAAVDPEPFRKFDASVKEASEGIECAADLNLSWSKQAFLDEFSSNPGSKFSSLAIQPGEKYSWKWDGRPLFVEIRSTNQSLIRLNGLFQEYATLLARLAEDGIADEERFDEMAKDLNSSVRDVLAAAGRPGENDGAAIFSAAAAESAKLFIRGKRRSALQDAIRRNAKAVQAWADLCSNLVAAMRNELKLSYMLRCDKLKDAWNGADAPARRKITAEMLELNDTFISSFSAMERLDNIYKGIPFAHAELADSLDGPESMKGKIQELYSEGKSLQRLYKTLKKSE